MFSASKAIEKGERCWQQYKAKHRKRVEKKIIRHIEAAIKAGHNKCQIKSRHKFERQLIIDIAQDYSYSIIKLQSNCCYYFVEIGWNYA